MNDLWFELNNFLHVAKEIYDNKAVTQIATSIDAGEPLNVVTHNRVSSQQKHERADDDNSSRTKQQEY